MEISKELEELLAEVNEIVGSQEGSIHYPDENERVFETVRLVLRKMVGVVDPLNKKKIRQLEELYTESINLELGKY